MNELRESTKHAWASNDVWPARRSTIHRADARLAVRIGAAAAGAMEDNVNTHVLTESLGFSGGLVPSLLSGRLDFERLKFDFYPPAQLLEVTVR